HVPWTRIVRDGETTGWEGKAIDLLEFAELHRNELVVKPVTEYGGSGVHLGWVDDRDAWVAAVREAVDRPSVIQRRVEVPSEPFPSVADGNVRLADFHADVDP